jgi:hypothetical protein
MLLRDANCQLTEVLESQRDAVVERLIHALTDYARTRAGFEEANIVAPGQIQFAMDGDWYILDLKPMPS